MTFVAPAASKPVSTDRHTIEMLNQQYLRAGEHGDVAWYSEHLAADFLSSAVDGSLSDKPAFLKRIAGRRAGSGFVAHDVRIRFVGELALVHAGFSCTKTDGSPGTGRYTDIYAQRDGRWSCVSAHFNFF
jgi:ketosteroid isomerase-like protein